MGRGRGAAGGPCPRTEGGLGVESVAARENGAEGAGWEETLRLTAYSPGAG